MDPEKFAKIQVQMKQNQQEYGDFLQDLDSWGKEMKEKDTALKNQGSNNKGALPPVRNSLNKKKKRKVKKPQQTEDGKKAPEKAKTKRISGFDFRAWDKFDVDKALDEMELRNTSSSSDLETDEEWEAERTRQMATVLKDQGNQYFKEGKYDEAVETYTRGIFTDSNNAILPANRAMALLKQGKYAAAESDCSLSITLDPTYVKAYARRAAARHAMGKLEESKKDYERVLKLDPGNKQAKEEIETINKKLNSALEITEDTGIVKPIYKPPEKRSKKPLRRLVVEEIGDDPDDRQRAIAERLSEQSGVQRKAVVQGEKEFEQFTNKGDERQISTAEKCKNVDLKLDLTRDDAKDAEDDEAGGASLPSHSSSVSPASSSCSPTSSLSCHSSPCTSPRIPAVPLNSFQFQRDWKNLKDLPDKFYQYFKEISPTQYQKLFGEALESDMLMMILKILLNHYDSLPVDCHSILDNLAKVKRFSMTVMFLSSQDKQVLTDLFSLMAEKGSYSQSQISQLKSTYGLQK